MSPHQSSPSSLDALDEWKSAQALICSRLFCCSPLLLSRLQAAAKSCRGEFRKSYSGHILDFAKGLKCQRGWLIFCFFLLTDAGRRSHLILALGHSTQNSVLVGVGRGSNQAWGQELAYFCCFPLIFPKTNLTSCLNIHEWGSWRPLASLASQSSASSQIPNRNDSFWEDTFIFLLVYTTVFCLFFVFCFSHNYILPLFNPWAVKLSEWVQCAVCLKWRSFVPVMRSAVPSSFVKMMIQNNYSSLTSH